MKLLNYPINDTFYNLVMDSKEHIRLCAPYVKDSIVNDIYEIKGNDVSVEIISSFNIGNFHRGSSDIEAFEYIINNNDKVYNFQLLHAKFYIFDDKYTIVTSANLTKNGFHRNLEYGVLIGDTKLVNQSIVDYDQIRDNLDTGKIKIHNIIEIQGILKNLPVYKESIPSSLSIEIDNVLDISIDELGNSISPWKKLTIEVIEKIQKKEFSLQDIYQFESIFQKRYPDNNTIKDSIRRNLQELRDLGFLKFLGNGEYLKLWNII